MDKDYCLVLAGGGTRGAYQVGAWKAISELGLCITAIAGTSIGAINAAFILQGDTKKLEELYGDIEIEDIIETGVEMDSNKDLFDIGNIVRIARDYIKKKGFNNEPLRILLEKNLNIEKIYSAAMDFGLVTYSVRNHKPLEIFRQDIPKEEFIQYLLASACFPIYKAQKIGENVFLDGGLYDNMPVNMLIKKGYTRFIVIDISGPGLKRGLISRGVYVKFIRPAEPLGGIFEFNKDRIQKNMRLGYLDTLKAFCKLQGHRYYFRTDDFHGLLNEFNLQTLAGLEFAADIYGMDAYRIYKPEDFLTELREKHQEAVSRYAELKKVDKITGLIREPEKIRHLLSRDMILCLVTDKIAEEPFFNGFGENLPFSDYISAGRALIELEEHGG